MNSKNTSVQIRKAEKKDGLILHKLYHEALHVQKRVQEIENDLEQNSVLIASLEDMDAGFVHFSDMAGIVHIHDIAVDIMTRNKGVAMALLDHIQSSTAGLMEIHLEIPTQNMMAFKFFKNRGFRFMELRKAYSPKDSDKSIMRKSFE